MKVKSQKMHCKKRKQVKIDAPWWFMSTFNNIYPLLNGWMKQINGIVYTKLNQWYIFENVITVIIIQIGRLEAYFHL
jgi:hypothetical protein